jgi:hypothetical protein
MIHGEEKSGQLKEEADGNYTSPAEETDNGTERKVDKITCNVTHKVF